MVVDNLAATNASQKVAGNSNIEKHSRPTYMTHDREIRSSSKTLVISVIIFAFIVAATSIGFGSSLAHFSYVQDNTEEVMVVVRSELARARSIRASFFGIYSLSGCDGTVNTDQNDNVINMLSDLRSELTSYQTSLCSEYLNSKCVQDNWIKKIKHINSRAGTLMSDAQSTKYEVLTIGFQSIAYTYNVTDVCNNDVYIDNLPSINSLTRSYGDVLEVVVSLCETDDNYFILRWLPLIGMLCIVLLIPTFLIPIYLVTRYVKQIFGHSFFLAERSDQEVRAKVFALVSVMCATLGERIMPKLQVISGVATLLTTVDLPSYHKKLLRAIERNVAHLIRTVHYTKELVTTEANCIEDNFHLIDIRACVEECLETFAHQAGLKGTLISATFGTGCPTQVMCDELRLRQVLLKTIGLAVEHTERGSVEVFVIVRSCTRASSSNMHGRNQKISEDDQNNLLMGSNAQSGRMDVLDGSVLSDSELYSSDESESDISSSNPDEALDSKSTADEDAGGDIEDILGSHRTESAQYEIQFEVKDSGQGMDSEELKNLLNPRAMRNRQGRGLRLLVASRICTLMGGSMEIFSAPGKGTTNVFTLAMPGRCLLEDFHPHLADPLMQDSVKRAQVITLGLPAGTKGSLSVFLKDFGITVVHAANVEQAVAATTESTLKTACIFLGDFTKFTKLQPTDEDPYQRLEMTPSQIFGEIVKSCKERIYDLESKRVIRDASDPQCVYVQSESTTEDVSDSERFVRLKEPIRARYVVEMILRGLSTDSSFSCFRDFKSFYSWVRSIPPEERRGLRAVGIPKERVHRDDDGVTGGGSEDDTVSIGTSQVHAGQQQQQHNGKDSLHASGFNGNDHNQNQGKNNTNEKHNNNNGNGINNNNNGNTSNSTPSKTANNNNNNNNRDPRPQDISNANRVLTWVDPPRQVRSTIFRTRADMSLLFDVEQVPPHLISHVNCVLKGLDACPMSTSTVGQIARMCHTEALLCPSSPSEAWTTDMLYEADKYYGNLPPNAPPPSTLVFSGLNGDDDLEMKDHVSISSSQSPNSLATSTRRDSLFTGSTQKKADIVNRVMTIVKNGMVTAANISNVNDPADNGANSNSANKKNNHLTSNARAVYGNGQWGSSGMVNASSLAAANFTANLPKFATVSRSQVEQTLRALAKFDSLSCLQPDLVAPKSVINFTPSGFQQLGTNGYQESSPSWKVGGGKEGQQHHHYSDHDSDFSSSHYNEVNPTSNNNVFGMKFRGFFENIAKNPSSFIEKKNNSKTSAQRNPSPKNNHNEEQNNNINANNPNSNLMKTSTSMNLLNSHRLYDTMGGSSGNLTYQDLLSWDFNVLSHTHEDQIRLSIQALTILYHRASKQLSLFSKQGLNAVESAGGANEGRSIVIAGEMDSAGKVQLRKCEPEQTAYFVNAVAHNYISSNAYTNFANAVFTLQSMILLTDMSDVQEYIEPSTRWALGIAAIGSSVGHPGVSSEYLCATDSFLSRVYNEQMVLQKHHVSMLFEILKYERANLFVGLSHEVFSDLKFKIVEAMLVGGHDFVKKTHRSVQDRVSYIHQMCVEQVDPTLRVPLKAMFGLSPPPPGISASGSAFAPMPKLELIRIISHLAPNMHCVLSVSAWEEWAWRRRRQAFVQSCIARIQGETIIVKSGWEKVIKEVLMTHYSLYSEELVDHAKWWKDMFSQLSKIFPLTFGGALRKRMKSNLIEWKNQKKNYAYQKEREKANMLSPISGLLNLSPRLNDSGGSANDNGRGGGSVNSNNNNFLGKGGVNGGDEENGQNGRTSPSRQKDSAAPLTLIPQKSSSFNKREAATSILRSVNNLME